MDAERRIPRRWLTLMFPLYLWIVTGVMSDTKRLFWFPGDQGNLSHPEAKAVVENRSEFSSNGAVVESGLENEIPFEVIYKSLISKNPSSGEQSLVSNRQSPGAKSIVSKKQSLVSKKQSSGAQSLRGSLNQSSNVQLLASQNQTSDASDVYPSIVSLKQNMQQISTGLARAFSPRDIDSWCTKTGYKQLQKKQRNPVPNSHLFKSPKGLLYVKVPKAASSTMAGVVDRIAHNYGGCDFQDKHTPQGVDYYYANRDQNASFLLGSIRDPAARAISRMFFEQVSQLLQEPTDENVLKWLNDTDGQRGSVSSGQGGFQLSYMSLQRIDPWSAFDWDHNTTVKNPKQVEQSVRRVIEQYDFIVVVERMDESLVILQMLLGVNAGDMLTLNSKVEGSYYYTTSRGCIPLVKSHVSPRVKEYLASDVWYAQNYGEYLLHAAASASLDKTIEALGRDRVERGLAEFRRLKEMANEMCVSKAFFACSEEGVAQKEKMNCYSGDHGCGYPCIDEMLSSKKTV